MKTLLFSVQGRINRAAYWKGIGIVVAVNVALAILATIIAQLAPHDVAADGTSTLPASALIPLSLISLAGSVFDIWAGLGLAIKRLHDRDRSGWFMFIQAIPLVGTIWYFVETACLPGTQGTNRFGPDPLALRRGSQLAFA
jgi:uncharacterized membrane protein YhaH (DUF805 family)